MRLWGVFRKSLREQLRDVLALSLSLVFGPFFVLLYAILLPSGSTTYSVLVMNSDAGATLADGSALAAGEEVVKAVQAVTYADGNPLLKVRPVTDRAEMETLLRDRNAAAYLLIPEDFSRAVAAVRDGDRAAGIAVTFGGDLTNPQYVVAGMLATTAVESYVQHATGQPPLVRYIEEPLGASAARTEFENYVPGLLVFAVVMMVFAASMTVAREVEAGTLRRLQLTRMSALEYLGGVTGSLAVFCVVSVVLTFLTALALGFRSQGPVWVAILVGALTSLSIVGTGLVVACFARSVTQAFLIANFPLGFYMFFSGSAFPIPKVPLFTVGSITVGLYDILPPTHAVVALNKVLTLGAGLGDVLYELAALLVLSVAYFAIGVWLFRRTHLRTR